jgi:hypothetical protein
MVTALAQRGKSSRTIRLNDRSRSSMPRRSHVQIMRVVTTLKEMREETFDN